MNVRTRATKLAVLAAFGAFALASGPLTTSPADGAPTPCPDGSSSVVSYRPQDVGKCELTLREGAIGLNDIRMYNIYCPGRMTNEDAVALGRALARNAPGLPAFASSVQDEFRRNDLVPEYAAVAHLFHYECRRGAAQGVATHLKIQLRGTRPSRVDEIASSCTFRARGLPEIGGRSTFDYEYQCKSHFKSNDSLEFIWDTAAKVLKSDFKLPNDYKYCMHQSTNIQCAPCSTSDKLVIRTFPKKRDERCPAGTVREVERSGTVLRFPVRN